MQNDELKNNKNKTNILDFQQRIRTYKILQTQKIKMSAKI